MIEVRALVDTEGVEDGQRSVEVALEGDRDVRRAERRHNLEVCGQQLSYPKYDEHRKSLQLIGGKILDLGFGTRVVGRQTPPLSVRKPPPEAQSLGTGSLWVEVVASYDKQRVGRDRRVPNARFSLRGQQLSSRRSTR